MTLVAGVDSSTQSCKVVVRDLETGELVRQGRAAHPDGTEVDPAAWWTALGEALAAAGSLEGVSAIAVGGQQHGMVALDAAGHVIRPALLWNDTRSAPSADALVVEAGAVELARRTGSVPVASFTATKLRWLRDAEPENAARVAAVALPHDWLTWRLLGYGPAGESPLGPVLDALVTDRSDASGTGYWSPDTGTYDAGLFELALGRGAREAAGAGAAEAATGGSAAAPSGAATPVILPRVLGPAESAGSTVAQEGAITIPAGVIVGAGMGDNAGAALGLGAASGDVVVSLGTSGTVFAVTDAPSHEPTGIVAGFADASGAYLPLVCTLNAARVLGTIADLLDVDFDELADLALRAPAGSEGVVLVPYFEGERTPNLPDATASLHGMSIASARRENVARAAVEGMLGGLAAGLTAVREVGAEVRRVLLVGGAALNPAVQAVAAQVFDVPVEVPAPGEYVADGAAVQAAWTLSGSRPAWDVRIAARPEPDHRPIVLEQYERYARLAAAQ